MAIRDYEAQGLVVHWDSEVCQHSGVCARSLPRVFRPQERPWIQTDAAAADELAATIDACPSGALGYTRTTPQETAVTQPATPSPDPETVAESPAGVTITVSENGPYEVHGPVTLVRADGTVLREGERLFLCRCGQSAKKPYCDNTHKRVGFADAGLGPAPTA